MASREGDIWTQRHRKKVKMEIRVRAALRQRPPAKPQGLPQDETPDLRHLAARPGEDPFRC